MTYSNQGLNKVDLTRFGPAFGSDVDPTRHLSIHCILYPDDVICPKTQAPHHQGSTWTQMGRNFRKSESQPASCWVADCDGELHEPIKIYNEGPRNHEEPTWTWVEDWGFWASRGQLENLVELLWNQPAHPPTWQRWWSGLGDESARSVAMRWQEVGSFCFSIFSACVV